MTRSTEKTVHGQMQTRHTNRRTERHDGQIKPPQGRRRVAAWDHRRIHSDSGSTGEAAGGFKVSNPMPRPASSAQSREWMR